MATNETPTRREREAAHATALAARGLTDPRERQGLWEENETSPAERRRIVGIRAGFATGWHEPQRWEVVQQWTAGRQVATDEGTPRERVLAMADSHHAAMCEAEDAMPLVAVIGSGSATFADEDTPWDDEGGETFAPLTDGSEIVIRPAAR